MQEDRKYKTMLLSISNIAWSPKIENEVKDLLLHKNVHNIEIAPTKFWPSISSISKNEACELKKRWAHDGFNFVAMQSLLYGVADAKLFGTDAEKQILKEALANALHLAEWLEIPILVFGSPKNRQKGNLTTDAAFEQAVIFFQKIAQIAQSTGTTLCFEANAKAYGCDFINTTAEAQMLVKAVNSSSFQLHIDIGNALLEEEDLQLTLKSFLPAAKHFHYSCPYMAPPTLIWREEQAIRLPEEPKGPRYCSIEMLTDTALDSEKVLKAIDEAIDTAQQSLSGILLKEGS